ncbi:MAG: lamin tail domain-containing protein, partial [Sphingomonadales bacterium]
MRLFSFLLFLIIFSHAQGQLLLNEGCNKNATAALDENGDTPDWVELYNASPSAINLANWKLTDQLNGINAWVLPSMNLAPNAFLRIFCSGKDRYASTPFTLSNTTPNFNPVSGWNTHVFNQAYNW